MPLLEDGEEILKVVHKHWLLVLSFALFLVFMVVVPIIIFVFLLTGSVSVVPTVLRAYLVAHIHWGAFGYSLWVLFLWILFFIEWTDYYLDMWVITNKRVISIEQKGFFNREIITLRYPQIQDVTVEVKGIVNTMFKLGLIQIETAGESRVIEMKGMNDPESAKAIIMEQQGARFM